MQLQESERGRLFWFVWSVLTVVVVAFSWNYFSTMG